MRYLCTSCAYIYDESIGDIEDGYEPGVKLYDMQDYFLCPMCGERVGYFQEIKEEVNYFDGSDNLTNLEDIHYPVVAQVDGKIKISIGKDEFHPCDPEHYISCISLLDEYGDIVEERFLNHEKIDEVIFDSYELDEFEIQVRCNIHGMWGIKNIKSIG